jgi:hypothetical protein
MARFGADHPNSLIAAGIHRGSDQRASTAAGLNCPIQNVCQRSKIGNLFYFQLHVHFASHQLIFSSCLFKRQKLKE